MPDALRFEIFRAGKYPRVIDAPEYGEDEWSASDVAALAMNYNTAYRKAPVVLGHSWMPGIPASGYVTSLDAVGGVLNATIEPTGGDAGAAMKRGIETGEYQQRSVELARDIDGTGKPYLLRLALLGGETPRVPGMAPITFAAVTHSSFASAPVGSGAANQPNKGKTQMNEDEKLVEALARPAVKEGWMKSLFGAKANPEKFSADIEALQTKVAALEAENAALKGDAEKNKADTLKAQADAYASKVIAERKLAPSNRDSIVEYYVAMGAVKAAEFAAKIVPLPGGLTGDKPKGEAPANDGGEDGEFAAYLAKPHGKAKLEEFVAKHKGDATKAKAELAQVFKSTKAMTVTVSGN